MRWLRFAVFILVVTLLQASNLLNLIALTQLNIKPNLLLIILVFFAIRCDNYEAIIISFVIGFAADISGSAMGPYTISFGLFGSILVYIRKIIIIRKMVHQLLAIFIMGLLTGALAELLALLKGQSVTSNIYVVLFGASLYSAAIGPYICSALLTIGKWMGIKKYRLGS